MTKEQIEKSGRDYALDQLGIVGLPGRAEAMKAFISGAQWRINSVWHDTNELPKHSGYLAALMDNGLMETLHYTVGIGFYAMQLKGYKLWAYIDDLLPDRKED